jgi:predicted AAA+ superfamily ATPase
MNPSLFLTDDYPLALDEWQEVPAIWDAVRFAVDQAALHGLFLLTGSVTPRRDAVSHSGAGRIARLRMQPMSLMESGDSSGEVSLVSLFDGEPITNARSKLNIDNLVHLIVRGGWPSNIKASREDAAVLPQQYIEALIESDISAADNVKRRPDLARLLLQSLASCVAVPTKNAAIIARTQERYGDVTRQTISTYIDAISRIHAIAEIQQWFPELRSKLRFRKAPKRIFCDPSIAAAALRANLDDLLRDIPTTGHLFENLCLRDLIAYMQANGGTIKHYHDESGLEADAKLELGTKWAPIEVKLGSHKVRDGAASIDALCSKMVASGLKPPAFKAIITSGEYSYTRPDGIHVIPIDCLGP